MASSREGTADNATMRHALGLVANPMQLSCLRHEIGLARRIGRSSQQWSDIVLAVTRGP